MLTGRLLPVVVNLSSGSSRAALKSLNLVLDGLNLRFLSALFDKKRKFNPSKTRP